MKKKVSLKDIAQQVGVSTALVSYVLSGKEKEGRVGQEMAEVIRATAKKMNYQPNQIAKSLKSGRSYTIGLIVADISNPFFAHIARTVEDEAKNDGYTTIFGSSDENSEKSQHLIDALINRQVDGFIIAPAEDSEKQIEYIKSLNIPFVLIDRYFPDIETNYVVIDNYKATYNATQHLLENGYRRIGLAVYETELKHMLDRIKGYEGALKEYGIVVDPALIRKIDFANTTQSVRENVGALLKDENPVEAILFSTNTLSVEGLRYLNELKYSIPDDVGVVCFDESDSFDFFYCTLTCVSQPLQQIAREAVQILVGQINRKDTELLQVVINPCLLIGESSGKP